MVEEAVHNSKFEIKEVITLASGRMKGADSLATKWGSKFGILVKPFTPNWDDIEAPNAIIREGKYGQYNARAGFDRNKMAVDYADAVILLQPDGDTGETSDIMEKAMKKGIPVFAYPQNITMKAGYAYEF